MSLPLEDIASLINSFPGMPGAAAKLLALIDDPEMSVSQIEAILRHDAGLTANILKLANSAYFGIPSKIGLFEDESILISDASTTCFAQTIMFITILHSLIFPS